MKRFQHLTLGALVVLAIVAFCPSAANAGGPFGCDLWSYWGVNGPYGLYGNRVNEVPYFAMFPPVYYSLPVPRPYGWSPFAYPPGVMTPAVEPPKPQTIINPHVPQPQAKPSSSEGKTRATGYEAPPPKEVINPFVKSADSSTPDASTRMASR
jgi:hypothetical protein